jgi:2-phospho-L-lactate guanylyltransferase
VAGVLAAALVPIKSFVAAKRRLEPVLAPDQRSALARHLAGGVLAALAEMPTFVACDDDEVATWASSHGAEVLWSVGAGLNGAVDHGIATIVDRGSDHILVSHADLPRPNRLPDVVRPGTVTLVPDRRLDGTNVMSFPASSPLPASYGAGSFGRHAAAARALGEVAVELRFDADLAIDVDVESDLTHPLVREVMPTWVRTILDNHR